MICRIGEIGRSAFGTAMGQGEVFWEEPSANGPKLSPRLSPKLNMAVFRAVMPNV
jgi:hypothetical protein